MRPLDLFAAMDVDKDNTVSPIELEAGLRRVGCTEKNSLMLTEEELVALLECFDANDDDAIDTREWKEGVTAAYHDAHRQQRLGKGEEADGVEEGGGEEDGASDAGLEEFMEEEDDDIAQAAAGPYEGVVTVLEAMEEPEMFWDPSPLLAGGHGGDAQRIAAVGQFLVDAAAAISGGGGGGGDSSPSSDDASGDSGRSSNAKSDAQARLYLDEVVAMLLPVTEAADLTFAEPSFALARLHMTLASAYANRQTVLNGRWSEREWPELKNAADGWKKAVSVWLQLAAHDGQGFSQQSGPPLSQEAIQLQQEQEAQQALEKKDEQENPRALKVGERNDRLNLMGRAEEEVPLGMALMELARLSAACTVPLTIDYPWKVEKKLNILDLCAARGGGGAGGADVSTQVDAMALHRQEEHALEEALRLLQNHKHPLLAKAHELQGALARTKYRTMGAAEELAAAADDANSFARPVQIVRDYKGSSGGQEGGDGIARATRGIQHGKDGDRSLAAYLAGAHALVELVRASHSEAVNQATSTTRRRRRYPTGRPTMSAAAATTRTREAAYSPTAAPQNPDAAAAAAAAFVYDIGAMATEEWRWAPMWRMHNWRDNYSRCLEGAAAVYSDRGYDEVSVALLVTATIALEPFGADGTDKSGGGGESKSFSPSRRCRAVPEVDCSGAQEAAPAGRRGRRGSIFAEGVENADGEITIRSPGPRTAAKRRPVGGTEGMRGPGGRPRATLAAALRRLGREGEAVFVEAGHRLIPVPVPPTTEAPVLTARERARLNAAKRLAESTAAAAAAAAERKRQRRSKKKQQGLLRPPPIQVNTHQVVEGATRFLGSRRASSPM
jgi:hypothetical protein